MDAATFDESLFITGDDDSRVMPCRLSLATGRFEYPPAAVNTPLESSCATLVPDVASTHENRFDVTSLLDVVARSVLIPAKDVATTLLSESIASYTADALGGMIRDGYWYTSWMRLE